MYTLIPLEEYKTIGKIPGVYRIHCLPTDMFYVGCSLEMCRRLRAHYAQMMRGDHCNQMMLSDYNLFGIEAFMCGVLEECEPENIFIREQYWFKRCGKNNRHRMYNTSLNSGVPWNMRDKCISPEHATIYNYQ